MKIYIIAAKRTPFGSFGGKLRNISPTKLGVVASKDLLDTLSKHSGLKEASSLLIDSIIYGNVLSSSSSDGPYAARHIGLLSGCHETTPALTINRLCGSGFQACISAAQEILSSKNEQLPKFVLAGGTENMSQSPFILRNIRWGVKLSFDKPNVMEDHLASVLADEYAGISMGMTAENLATLYDISRHDCEEYAYRSHCNASKAQSTNVFKDEIVPITIPNAKGVEVLDKDEGIRHDIQKEKLASLPPVFKKEGCVTAGTSSGITDGAASLIIASEATVRQYHLEPLARIVDWQVTAVDPKIMGIGPVSAIQKILERTKLTLKDMDQIEINEAFAAQVLAVWKALKEEDMTRLNPNGGAIALGHPLAASGARILTHLSYQINKHHYKYAIGSACIGGGQGIAVLLSHPSL